MHYRPRALVLRDNLTKAAGINWAFRGGAIDRETSLQSWRFLWPCGWAVMSLQGYSGASENMFRIKITPCTSWAPFLEASLPMNLRHHDFRQAFPPASLARNSVCLSFTTQQSARTSCSRVRCTARISAKRNATNVSTKCYPVWVSRAAKTLR